MLPSWFTKLRDVKGGSKHSKQQDKLHEPPPTASKKQQEVPVSLAKSFSLRRASSKARNALFESKVLEACRSEENGRLSFSSSESHLCKGMQVSFLLKEATGCEPRGTSPAGVDPKNLYTWDSDVQSFTNCKGGTMPKISPGEESQASTQKWHVLCNNDTEDFALTSETSSTFGSETSSADSSGSSKCSSCEEEGHDRGQIWQEGFRSSGCTCRSMQKDHDGLFKVQVTEEQTESNGCVEVHAELMSRLCQETVEIQHRPLFELQRGRQASLFSSSMNGVYSSVSSKDERDGGSFPSNALKSSRNSNETGKRCTHTEKLSILSERNANELRSRLEGDGECSLLNNSALNQQAADWKMPFRFSGRSKMRAMGNFTSDLRADKHMACTPKKSSLAVAHCSLQERENAHSMVGSPEMMTDVTSCAHRMSISDNTCGKCSTVQMQKRRQRGSSISAVLPPNLQGVVGDSLAFVKISDDPYEDFRQSMYEMIMEKDLEGSMDVEELLYCYLTLNSPEHHELIEEVFSDVWSAVLMTMR